MRRRATHRSARSVSPTRERRAAGARLSTPARSGSRSLVGDGIATGITAAAVTITATRTAGTGFVTVYPAGTARPETSILNLEAGSDTANSGIVPVSADGALDVYASVQTDLIVDVTGTFTAATTAYQRRPVRARHPSRLLDTRAAGGAALAPGGRITCPVATRRRP